MTGREKGIVKRFDNEKGYGFIEFAQGEDAFFHSNAIRAAGVSTLSPGQPVEFAVEVGPKGPIARDIVLEPIPTREIKTGMVKCLDDDRDYGFIECTEGKDVFFHRSEIRTKTEGKSTLFPGQQVKFEEVQFRDRKHPTAVNVKVIENERGTIMCFDDEKKSGYFKRENDETIPFDYGDVWSEDLPFFVGQQVECKVSQDEQGRMVAVDITLLDTPASNIQDEQDPTAVDAIGKDYSSKEDMTMNGKEIHSAVSLRDTRWADGLRELRQLPFDDPIWKEIRLIVKQKDQEQEGTGRLQQALAQLRDNHGAIIVDYFQSSTLPEWEAICFPRDRIDELTETAKELLAQLKQRQVLVQEVPKNYLEGIESRGSLNEVDIEINKLVKELDQSFAKVSPELP